MSDTHVPTSPPLNVPLATVTGLVAIIAGVILRYTAMSGELWFDELWSILKVSDLSSPTEILTTVKHDNNHILNSVWMWLWGAAQQPLVYRLPSFLCGVALLAILFFRRSTNHLTNLPMVLWLTLVAFSYPLTLYGTEARGYSMVLLCAALTYLSLATLMIDPFDRKALVTCAISGVVGCFSHAVYVLFLAPAVAWLFWRLVFSPNKGNTRRALWCGLGAPVLVACLLILTFYHDMEIGGGPSLPYLKVAASTISTSFGGASLSSENPDVTRWSILLSIAISLVCISELAAWMRSGEPIATLVGLIVATPWIAVAIIQPNFILPRYFIIQIFFCYLLAARFLDRLVRRSSWGAVMATVLLVTYVFANTSRSVTLASLGRSHFVEIFRTVVALGQGSERTIGGDQDFQNNVRLLYAQRIAPDVSNIRYVPNYSKASPPPRFLIRETLDAYEFFPEEWLWPQGAKYQQIRRYPAPELNGSHVTVYERLEDSVAEK